MVSRLGLVVLVLLWIAVFAAAYGPEVTLVTAIAFGVVGGMLGHAGKSKDDDSERGTIRR